MITLGFIFIFFLKTKTILNYETSQLLKNVIILSSSVAHPKFCASLSYKKTKIEGPWSQQLVISLSTECLRWLSDRTVRQKDHFRSRDDLIQPCIDLHGQYMHSLFNIVSKSRRVMNQSLLINSLKTGIFFVNCRTASLTMKSTMV